MNLSKLFELQRQLDERIEREHPRQEGEDRLAKKILALMVELGELLNELPEIFKFWSNKKNNREKALEEFCDALHFILSIGLEMKVDHDLLILDMPKADTAVEQFLNVFQATKRLGSYYSDVTDYELLLSEFVNLGEMLGFSWEEVEEAYLRKNAVNHERQESGY